MTAETILAELRPLGRDGYKKILLNHGVKEPCLGVKIADLQTIRKRVGKDHALALALYDTGVYDAMYLAGLIADDARMTKTDLRRWARNAEGGALAGSTVPGVAAGSPHGWELALEWIESERPLLAVVGWATLSAVVSVRDDASLDLAVLRRLLRRVRETIHQAPDPVRYQMNAFVIALGGFVKPLFAEALRAAEEIGPVSVDMGDTACQVPHAPEYLRKIEQRGTIGRKRKSVKC